MNSDKKQKKKTVKLLESIEALSSAQKFFMTEGEL